MERSWTYWMVVEIARAMAYAEGYAQGYAEGLAEGALAEARKLVRLLGDKAFGPPDAATAATIEQLKDLPPLEELLVRMLWARSWQEVFSQVPLSHRRRPRRRFR